MLCVFNLGVDLVTSDSFTKDWKIGILNNIYLID